MSKTDLTASQKEKLPRTSKSGSAFRTISEVSDEVEVPQHVLRFWETKFSQIRPLKRGGGRRYYRPEDIDVICNIRNLLYREGYTIKGVQKLLKEKADLKDDKKKNKNSPQPPASSIPDNARNELQTIASELTEMQDMLKELT
ncbi:MAG: MerR family transcriptional regulator [Alphaproteobacteria bacterium]|nr:MerR family transcriptional regulator [Alphaproteobacteria bacterium]